MEFKKGQKVKRISGTPICPMGVVGTVKEIDYKIFPAALELEELPGIRLSSTNFEPVPEPTLEEQVSEYKELKDKRESAHRRMRELVVQIRTNHGIRVE